MMALFYNDAVGKFILRLTVGRLIMFHGVAKILHGGSLDVIGGMLSQSGLPIKSSEPLCRIFATP